eukprot:12260565-Prorocentrum_lima.AAC.1
MAKARESGMQGSQQGTQASQQTSKQASKHTMNEGPSASRAPLQSGPEHLGFEPDTRPPAKQADKQASNATQ